MSSYTDRLYQLLPAIYRIRDAERAGKLQALLKIIGEQADLMDADIARLYDNAFIETCDEWLVPYLGDLLGVQGLHPVSDGTFSQRARVANTLRYRRRKGTAAMLEQLARDTTGWNARVVEFFQRLGTTQYLNHRRPRNLRTPDLRDANALELTGTPFDTTARSADVRRIASRRGQFNLPNIGIFLWRLQAYPVNRAPAFDHGNGCFSFSQLGHDAPLFNHPVTEGDISHLADETNVPAPIRRRALLADKAAYYGEELSLCIWTNGQPAEAEIVPCDLTDWTRRPGSQQIAVDPELGRLAFPVAETPERVEVRYAYGFSSELGGGFYDRDTVPTDAAVFPIAKSTSCDSLKKAITAWNPAETPNALFLVQDSEFYDEKIDLSLPAGCTLEIRAGLNEAKEQQRPVVRLSGAMKITGEAPAKKTDPGATLILDGLWVAGNAIEIQKGDLGALQFRHCTLVPGLNLKPDGTPAHPDEPSVSFVGANEHLQVSFVRSIAGALALGGAEKLTVLDSIITTEAEVALDAPTLVVEQSTVLGGVKATVVELASNSIFTGPVVAERRQEGCVRFCSLPLNSKVPRRHRCQPTLAIQQALEATTAEGKSLSAAAQATIATRLQSVFTTERYGQPGFGQLHSSGPREIFTGANDESEMGAFHHLHEPQREANLRASLDEYLRAGMEAEIFYVDLPDLKPKDQI